MGKLKRAIGLMSGTSMDGIDVALIETDGMSHVERGPAMTYPYSEAFREHLRRAVADAAAIRTSRDRPGTTAMAEQYLTDLHGEAVLQFLEDGGISTDTVDVIGFHGHTVLHDPSRRLTVQLGDGPRLARLTGLDVVHDLRSADVAAGGQGAPLVPIYHRALAEQAPSRPVAFVNIGGVANVTFVAADGALTAFDTGPGNALLDDWMRTETGAGFDANGETALNGRVDDRRLHDALMHPYFAAHPPKSIDRNAFSASIAAGLSLADGAATLAALTAQAVARAREHLPVEPTLWVVCGGGRRNRAIMAGLAERVENAVVPAEALGLNGDSIEAEAWAYLAVRSLVGLAITYPGTTGVSEPMRGGVLARKPRRWP
ncbi:MAG: anhydro-N-acetylmuramic acid kinase [Hyphomicrobiaceae bacterium]|nr:anhydro-N-acetylmuramic acid kinase [Hyphomicrobiaceae bacterium]